MKFANAQAGLHLCCLHASKSGFLATRPICKFAHMLQIYNRLNAVRKNSVSSTTYHVLTRASLNFLADGLSNKSIDDGNKNTKVVTKLKEKEKHFYMLIFYEDLPN